MLVQALREPVDNDSALPSAERLDDTFQESDEAMAKVVRAGRRD